MSGCKTYELIKPLCTENQDFRVSNARKAQFARMKLATRIAIEQRSEERYPGYDETIRWIRFMNQEYRYNCALAGRKSAPDNDE